MQKQEIVDLVNREIAGWGGGRFTPTDPMEHFESWELRGTLADRDVVLVVSQVVSNPPEDRYQVALHDADGSGPVAEGIGGATTEGAIEAFPWGDALEALESRAS